MSSGSAIHRELTIHTGMLLDDCSARTPPKLVTLPSPYRLILRPILDYVIQIQKENPSRQIAVIVPELVEKHWYHYPLHNQRAEFLKALILLHGSGQIVLINVPWYLNV